MSRSSYSLLLALVVLPSCAVSAEGSSDPEQSGLDGATEQSSETSGFADSDAPEVHLAGPIAGEIDPELAPSNVFAELKALNAEIEILAAEIQALRESIDTLTQRVDALDEAVLDVEALRIAAQGLIQDGVGGDELVALQEINATLLAIVSEYALDVSPNPDLSEIPHFADEILAQLATLQEQTASEREDKQALLALKQYELQQAMQEQAQLEQTAAQILKKINRVKSVRPSP